MKPILNLKWPLLANNTYVNPNEIFGYDFVDIDNDDECLFKGNETSTNINNNENEFKLDDIDFFDLINYSDSQLEQVILNDDNNGGGKNLFNQNNDEFCNQFNNLSFKGTINNNENNNCVLNKEDLDYFNIKPSKDFNINDIIQQSPIYNDSPLLFDDDCFNLDDYDRFNLNDKQIDYNNVVVNNNEDEKNFEPDVNAVANYEEVYTTVVKEQPKVESDLINDFGKNLLTIKDDENRVKSPFSSIQSPLSSDLNQSFDFKRKFNNDDDENEDEEVELKKSSTSKIKKRRKIILDDRIKDQNRTAAKKYRQKKQKETMNLNSLYEQEKCENDQLNNQVEELTVQINVLKELLSKYLSPELFNNQVN